MAKQPRSISGKVVAITGGARGIGRATGQALTAKGARVAIGDLDGDLARKTAGETGPDARGYDLNVTDRASFEAFVDAVESEMGPLDVLVNNAGIMALGRFDEEDDATAARQVDINLHGVMYGMKIVLPRMRQRGHGHLVNIASSAGKGGFPGGATYCATKHAVVGLSEAVRGELRGSGVDMSLVMPGVVNTELATGLKQARGVSNVEPEDVADAIADALEQGRFEVFVPKSIGPITRVLTLVPRPARDALVRVLKADRVLIDAAESGERTKYELRAAHSEPGLEPGAEKKELGAGSAP